MTPLQTQQSLDLRFDDSGAYDINDSGQVVGTITLNPPSSCRQCPPAETHAFIYQNGVLTDVNTLLPSREWQLQWASAIINKGQIVGNGLHYGQNRAFLLTLD